MRFHTTHHIYKFAVRKKVFEKIFFLEKSPVQPLLSSVLPTKYDGPSTGIFFGLQLSYLGYSVGPKYEFVLIDKGIVERVAVTFSGHRQ